MKIRVALMGLLLAAPSLAQQSASYTLTESALNAGGNPDGGVVLTSASHRITLDSIGDPIRPFLVSGPSWSANAGFVFAYPPPGEVLNLSIAPDRVTLGWDGERSVGTYNLYRALISTLAGLAYGSCQVQGIGAATTVDAEVPPSGNGYFYLVTAENRLDEEGTKGFASSGMERHGTACP